MPGHVNGEHSESHKQNISSFSCLPGYREDHLQLGRIKGKVEGQSIDHKLPTIQIIASLA